MRGLVGLLLAIAGTQTHLLAQGTNTIRSETKVVLVDAVVTDKKGYVHNLTAEDFAVFEDDKKQTISSFSAEGDPAAASKAQAHYMMFLFDDSSMDNSAQRRARAAAIQFVEANAGPNQMIAIVNFRGAVQVAQNFTADTARLKTVLAGGAPSALSVNGPAPGLNSAASLDAHSLFLAVRGLARDLASVPGRKTLVLLSADSQLKAEEHSSEINAALDACNRANVAIYGIDTRGFVATPAGFDGRVGVSPGALRDSLGLGGQDCSPRFSSNGCQQASADADSSLNQPGRLVNAFEPQRRIRNQQHQRSGRRVGKDRQGTERILFDRLHSTRFGRRKLPQVARESGSQRNSCACARRVLQRAIQ